MEFAPAQWLIQLIALLPAALRPGVFLALIIALVWFIFIRRGLPDLWHALCRAAAVTVHIVVRVLLLPEYLVTTARRTQGRQPGAAALAFAPVAQQMLDAATATYERNSRKSTDTDSAAREEIKATPEAGAAKSPGSTPRKTRFPWFWCGLAIVVCAGAWIAMDNLIRAEAAKKTFAEAFEYWRDIEAWANVDRSDRAAPGDPATPNVVSVSYHAHVARMSIRCGGNLACRSTVKVRTHSGAVIASRPIDLEAGDHVVVTLHLARVSARTRHRLHVDVDATTS